MIAKIKDISPELQSELKRWAKIAKQNKLIPTLLIFDTLLKNTRGYENKGIIKFIENTIQHPLQEITIIKALIVQKKRYKENNVDIFKAQKLNYWFFLTK